MKLTAIVLLLILCIIQCPNISGQDNFQIYLHTDRTYYFPGESVYFKAYLLGESKIGSTQINDTLNVAIIDQEGLEITSGIFPVNNSLLTASIELPEFITEGNYLLIASTLSMNVLSPEKMFARPIEIRKSVGFYLITDLSLTETQYASGSPFTAKIRFSEKGNKPAPATFSYQLKGSSGELINGKGKADIEGFTTIILQLPQFDEKETMKLIVNSSYKGTKSITGIVIPTKYNYVGLNTDSGLSVATNNIKHLNIQVKTDKMQYEQNDNVRLDISVTDEKGTPVITNLSVSASNLIYYQLPNEKGNLVNYSNRKSNPSEVSANVDIRKYFAQYLLQITQSPGRPFIVQEKNNPKKLNRKSETGQQKQYGYSSDRNIFDILMQIKPYHIESGKIIFGINAINSINNLDGSLIVVDGVKMGTDASILNSIPVPDIAKITASTNVMDIQRYSSMNSVGLIEITMKKTADFINKEENAGKSKSNTLFWGPEIITDSSGKASLNFNNIKSGEVLVSVDGIAANGQYGSGSAQYTVK